MFKTTKLPWLIMFFAMFYNDQPVDWLLEHFIDTLSSPDPESPESKGKVRTFEFLIFKEISNE